jgi:chromosome segregation ATPase
VDQSLTPGESGSPEPPEVAAERARERLHAEIERVRSGVEEMLAEQEGGIDDTVLRRELDALREETDFLLKRRVRKTEKRLNKRINKVNARTDALEQRLDQVEQERQHAEWRIHTSNEQMLDGLLQEIRAIADLLTGTGSTR